MKGIIGIFLGLLCISMNSGLHAADTDDPGQKTKDEELKELAMDVQNPVSDLWRFGFNYNTRFGTGPTNSTINNVNLIGNTTRQFGQWSIINRFIVPLLYLPESVPDAPSGDSGRSVGLGDIEWTSFLVRDESKRWFKSIGGLGPTIIFKTATDDRMGQGKWTIGANPGHCQNNGSLGERRASQESVVVRGRFRASQSDSVRAPTLCEFIIFRVAGIFRARRSFLRIGKPTAAIAGPFPLAGGFGKVLFRGERHPINLRFQSFYFIEKPDSGPDWSLQINLRILFPK